MRMDDKQPQYGDIIFVIRYFHPFTGGLEKKAERLAAALSARGYRIRVITSRFYLSWPAAEQMKGFAIHRLPSPRIKIVGACVFLLSLLFYLVRNKKDILGIHAFQVGYSSSAAVLTGIVLGKPTILSLSGSGPTGDVRRHRKTPWGKAFLWCCRRASRIVILNDEMRSELQSIGCSTRSTEMIPNGVDCEVYKPAGTTTSRIGEHKDGVTKTILYTGRLSREKGIDFLIRSYASLELPYATRLCIYGNGPELRYLQTLIQKHALENRVIIHAAVEGIIAVLQKADLFVLPSRCEGMSNALLEAMACALPVIATRVPGNTALVHHGRTGLLVDYGDEQAMSATLKRLLNDAALGREMGLRARASVCTHNSLHNLAESYCRLYQHCYHRQVV